MIAGNPIQGEAPLLLGGVTYTLVYDWRALARMAHAVGSNANLFDPHTLATILVIGLDRHHQGVGIDLIFDASPPMAAAVADFNRALHLAYFGHRKPGGKEGEEGAVDRKDDDQLDQIARACATAFRAGVRPCEFWGMTPFQTGLLIEANGERLKDEFETLIAAGWHTAVFSRAKTIPPLKTLFRKEHDPTQINDDDDPDQIAAKQMIAAMMGATKARSITTHPTH